MHDKLKYLSRIFRYAVVKLCIHYFSTLLLASPGPACLVFLKVQAQSGPASGETTSIALCQESHSSLSAAPHKPCRPSQDLLSVPLELNLVPSFPFFSSAFLFPLVFVFIAPPFFFFYSCHPHLHCFGLSLWLLAANQYILFPFSNHSLDSRLGLPPTSRQVACSSSLICPDPGALSLLLTET